MKKRRAKDAAFRAGGQLIALAVGVVLFAIVIVLVARSLPLFRTAGLGTLLFSDLWHPTTGEFGLRPYISGTLWVTGIAMLMVVPVGVLAAIYLSEYARPRVKSVVVPVVDLLAGVPSVVFGACGVIVVVPLVRDIIAPAVGGRSTGYSVLAGSIVLAVMVWPLMISGSLEMLRAVPDELREAALSLGATRWESIRFVVLRKAAVGIFTSGMLSFARALGETMAVLMVVGNVARVPRGLLQPAYPLPALIANNYGEMLSIPMYDAALMFAALVLMVVIVVFNVAARLVLQRIKRGIS